MPYKDPVKRREYQRRYKQLHEAELKARIEAWRLANREHIRQSLRANAYRRLYGLTIPGYDALLLAQSGCCAICGIDKPRGRGKRFHVDHNHATGHVRGLLCNRCNSNLGWMENYLNTVVLYLTVPPPPGSVPTEYSKRNPTLPRESSRAAASPRESAALSFKF